MTTRWRRDCRTFRGAACRTKSYCRRLRDHACETRYQLHRNRRKLITAIVNEDFALDRPLLMAQPILTRPGQQRIALTVPVHQLTVAINELTQLDGTIEHVNDY